MVGCVKIYSLLARAPADDDDDDDDGGRRWCMHHVADDDDDGIVVIGTCAPHRSRAILVAAVDAACLPVRPSARLRAFTYTYSISSPIPLLCCLPAACTLDAAR